MLREHWRVEADSVDYLPVGYGGYHWLATASERRLLVTADARRGPVVACYELARRLADEGLDAVRAPVPTATGRVAIPFGDWWLSAWPWVDGRSAFDGRHASDADLDAVAAVVRRLHDHPQGAIPAPLVDDWAVDGWARFEAAVDGSDAAAGPYAADVRALLAARLGYVRDLRERYDGLAANRPPVGEWVITHGEPHAANVVHTAAGPVLIDWDTVRLAPRERDLWVLAGYRTWRKRYGEAAVDPALLEAYRLRWDLTDIALFVPDLLEAPARTPDLDVAVEEVRRYLIG